jgi:hypothetical protein
MEKLEIADIDPFAAGNHSQPDDSGPSEDLSILQMGPEWLLPLSERIAFLRERHPYVSTVIETAAVWTGRQAVRSVVARITGTNLGNGWQGSRLGDVFDKKAVAKVLTSVVVSPVVEELILRKTPSDYLDRKGQEGLRGRQGVAAAALFAAGHAGPVGSNALPLPQFIGGLNYWRLQRMKGYKHAVLSHATQNAMTMAADYMRLRIAQNRTA